MAASIKEHANMTSLDACKTFCIYNQRCTGIEYSRNHYGGICLVWIRRQGINATAALKDYNCLSYATTLKEGTWCAQWVRVEGNGSPDQKDRYKCLSVKEIDGGRRLFHI
eukprot:TRINITY_DN3618_c1_g1_i2.p1 TRINITY_DN3618_c1_g1~~TRINITY_DN3618_c1_g1_i2.p1  ORF type:complete len:110 (-),score=17.96 TRINITY_DN3618_c1_g1_i2:47-376(-)